MAAPPAFVNVCTGLGINLPVLQPVAGVATGILTGLLAPVTGPLNSVVGNVNINLQRALSGKSIGIGVLDPATNTFVNVPGGQCKLTADGFQIDNNVGVSLGGGQITGLGGTGNATALAGDASAIALGNGATTAAGVTNAIALGTGASASAANSIALGANSVAARGAVAGYSAFGLTGLQTSAGEVSFGAANAPRQLTNVAAGTADSDAATVGQMRGSILPLQAASRLSVGYVPDANGNPTAVVNLAGNPNLPAGTTESRLTGVARGTISAGSNDAVNGSQLYAGNSGTAGILGGGATYDAATGTFTNPSYVIQGVSYTTVGSALNALSGSINGSGNQKYFQANSSLANAAANGMDSIAIGPVAVASATNGVAIGNGATSSGQNSVALGSGSTDGGLSNVVSVGAAGAERRIVNLAAGTLSATSTDAVNGAQLYQTNQQVAALGHSAVQYATDSTGQTLSSVTLASDQGGPVIIHNLAPGVVGSDAATVQQVQDATANSVQYQTVNGVKTNTIALKGGSAGPVTVSNVAAGVAPTDAVNVAQLEAATGTGRYGRAYVDGQISNLTAYTDKQISQARKDAAGGTALALAATGLRYLDLPGKTSISGATSYYHDQMGIAFGIGQTSEDGRFRFNAAVTASPTMSSPDVGAVMGASMTLN